MGDISFDTKCTIAATIAAVITAAVVVYNVRVRHARVDSEAVRWTGILLGLSFGALIVTVLDLPSTDNATWIYAFAVVGFAALFAWVIRPKT